MRRLKTTEVALIREKISAQQGHKCAACGAPLKGRGAKKAALDHCHTTGKIRGVLCLNCNGMEGKLNNIARRAMKDDPDGWIERILAYRRKTHYPLLHPTHKTDAEKRARKNKLARERRARLKGQT